MTLPLVSIIIPTYNRKDLLAEAVQSCLDQTWSNLEVIIVDDGSTDGTDAFANGLLSGAWQGQNIKFYRQQNSGASAARNYGLSLATGKYIQFLDSDDLLFAEKIRLQATKLELSEQAHAEGCSCYGQLGEAVNKGPSHARIGIFCSTPREYIEGLCSRIVHGMQTSAPLWRKSFLIGQTGWRTDITLGDDLEYHIRLLISAKGMLFVEQELFWVREHAGPRLSDFRKALEKVLSLFRTRRAIYEALTKSGQWNETMQKNFLGAMQTIYANMLSYGTDDDIREIERFIYKVASHPVRRFQLLGLIATRRCLGKKTLLKAHGILSQLKTS